MDDKTLTISIDADTSQFESALKELEKHASTFGGTLTGALKSALVSGKTLESMLRSIALSMAGSALGAGLAPLENILNGLGSRLFGSFAKVTPFAQGGVPGGGIIANPTYFPNGGSVGLMGEAGGEAILPLKRASDGSLGVASNGNSNSASANITINISTSDPTGFQRSIPQISAALTRAVVRGQRSN